MALIINVSINVCADDNNVIHFAIIYRYRITICISGAPLHVSAENIVFRPGIIFYYYRVIMSISGTPVHGSSNGVSHGGIIYRYRVTIRVAGAFVHESATDRVRLGIIFYCYSIITRVSSAPGQDCSGDRPHLIVPIRYCGMIFYSYLIIIRVYCAIICYSTKYIASFH